MKVSDLIAQLQQLPADLEVLVEGYETGFDPIHALEIRTIDLNAAAEEWDGEFEESPDGAQEALLILGRRGHRRD
jgi:hypothetical protein